MSNVVCGLWFASSASDLPTDAQKKQGAAGRRARRALAAFKRANNPCFGSPLIAQLVPGQGLSMPNKD
jgi:hypothetical protein